MQALRLTILLICFLGFSEVSQARPVDVGGTLEEADRFGNQQAVSSVFEPIAGSVAKAKRSMKPLAQKPKSTYEKVSSWLSSKRKAWFPSAEEKALAKKQQEAGKMLAERKKKLKNLEATLPSYITKDKGIDKQQLEKAREDVTKLGTSVVTPAIAPDGKIPLNKAGVPVAEAFDKKKKGKKTIPVVKEKIAKLNVGRPEQILASDLALEGFQPAKIKAQQVKALKSPLIHPEKKTLDVIASATFDQAFEPGDPRSAVKFDSKLVTQKMVDQVQLVLASERPVDLKAHDEMTANQFKMLAAMIMYNKGDKCEVLLGLFEELREVDDLRNAATFHLGACAQTLKLYSSGHHYLSKLIKSENAEYAEKSLLLLVKDLPRDYESEFAKMVLALKNKGIITKAIQDSVFYRVSKGSFHKGDLKTAKLYANKVSAKSKFYKDARFVKAVSDYALGQMSEAEAELKNLRSLLINEGSSDDNMLSLTAVNLARIQFQQGRYASAVKTFAKVKKSHSLWVTALVEQGWAQIMVDDPAGAIGNMYSLHSPFFKGVYKPESYVVRTIGYLNICQYGDAYKTLSMMEDKYRPWNQQIDRYIQTQKLAKNYYKTVTKYLRGDRKLAVDGLPYQVIREMARHKDFLNAQKSINFNFDEIDRYPSVVARINKERSKYLDRLNKAKKRLRRAMFNLKQAKVDKTLAPRMSTFRSQIAQENGIIEGYKYLVGMMDDSKRRYRRVRAAAEGRLDKRQYNLRERAGKALYAHLSDMNTSINRFLTNNEFLRYEVFAGSGQNIRYQVAGGNTSGKAKRIPASVKPKKSLDWSFSGEYWEDEIGSYRSSLKNNCPQEARGRSLPKRRDDQANL
jgi:hypothetical protein